MEKKKNNSLGARKESGPKASQKKHRRARKPKFELGKSKHGYDKKKKDKKKKQTVAIYTAKLVLEEFPLIFTEIRAGNQRLKELISKIDTYILDKLKTMDDEDKGF